MWEILTTLRLNNKDVVEKDAIVWDKGKVGGKIWRSYDLIHLIVHIYEVQEI